MAKVLIIGSGGREHALAWKLSQSPLVERVIVAPGGAAMGFPRWDDVDLDGNFESIAERAKSESIDLVVVGPDNPLADGIVDVLQSHGVLTFGPSKGAAQIEASKAFSKDVMKAAGVPTADYREFENAGEAKDFLRSSSGKWVVKADGLAFGKGVVVGETTEECVDAVDSLIAVSGKVLIEERLVGEEVSWMAFCDGERAALLDPARDYKPLFDHQKGPNTGGMGAYSPVPEMAAKREWVRENVFHRTLSEMKNRGVPFKGLLYAGLMYDQSSDQFWVLEFNARFGDPETQVLLPRMKDDLYEWCVASAKGEIHRDNVAFADEPGVFVVASAEGYPSSPKKGDIIEGELSAPSFFAAGVSGNPGEWKTSGGRVLGALGRGPSIDRARENAYLGLKRIQFRGMHYRTDIAAT